VSDWHTRLADPHRIEHLTRVLAKPRRYGLIVVDADDYPPVEADAANLFFQFVSSRYEHAFLLLTSNLPRSGWKGACGDQAVAAALIDRIVHHANVLTFHGA
jgi:DNA replication protein DnaC